MDFAVQDEIRDDGELENNFDKVQEDFLDWRKVCAKMIKESGKTNVRVTNEHAKTLFDSEKQGKVTHKRKAECMLEEPDDQIYDVKEYEDEFGDYKTNGMGHVKGTMEGVTGIIVPGRKVWKIKRRRGTEAAIEQTLYDGENVMDECQAQRNFEQLATGISHSDAVGATVDQVGRTSRRSIAHVPPVAE